MEGETDLGEIRVESPEENLEIAHNAGNIQGELEELHSSCLTKKSDDDGKLNNYSKPIFNFLFLIKTLNHIFQKSVFLNQPDPWRKQDV